MSSTKLSFTLRFLYSLSLSLIHTHTLTLTHCMCVCGERGDVEKVRKYGLYNFKRGNFINFPGELFSLLYQAYGCKEMTKYRVANQTIRRQVKNLTTVLTNKRNKNVLLIVLVSMRKCVTLRSKMIGSCISRN